MVGFVLISRAVNTVDGLSSDLSFSLKHIGRAKTVRIERH